jgi:hypothetical protein
VDNKAPVAGVLTKKEDALKLGIDKTSYESEAEFLQTRGIFKSNSPAILPPAGCVLIPEHISLSDKNRYSRDELVSNSQLSYSFETRNRVKKFPNERNVTTHGDINIVNSFVVMN